MQRLLGIRSSSSSTTLHHHINTTSTSSSSSILFSLVNRSYSTNHKYNNNNNNRSSSNSNNKRKSLTPKQQEYVKRKIAAHRERKEAVEQYEKRREERDKLLFKKNVRTVYLDHAKPKTLANLKDRKWEIPKPVPLPELRPAKAPDAATIISGHANCPGCGAKFQTADDQKSGFIHPSAIETYIEHERIFHKVQKKLIAKKLLDIEGKNTNSTTTTRSDDREEMMKREVLNKVLNRDDPNTVDYEEMLIFDRMRYPKPLTCIRCHQLTNYGKALTAEITADDFRNQLAKIGKEDALFVVIIDLFDVESSFIPGLGDLIGHNPVLIAGNKVDLLPSNVGMERVKAWLKHECNEKLHMKVNPTLPKRKRRFYTDDPEEQKRQREYEKQKEEEEDAAADDSQIKGVTLVSSKVGTNIKELCARIEKLRKGRDVYVIGCTNVGKSTLINRLLKELAPVKQTKGNRPSTRTKPENGGDEAIEEQSDYSNVSDPSQIFKLEVESIQREKEEKQSQEKEENAVDVEKELQLYQQRNPLVRVTTSMVPGTTLKSMSFVLQAQPKPGEHKPRLAHLYDTPGIINKRSVLQSLDPEDWKDLFPANRIVPHHYRLRPGRSMFIGGIARIDYVGNEGNPQEEWNRAFFTVFTSSKVAVHTTGIDKAADVFTKHFGTKMLAPPVTKDLVHRDKHPLKTMDQLQVIQVKGHTRAEAIIDIVIAGVGWVSLTGVGDITLHVHHSKKVHVATRDPLMPYETYKLTKDRWVDG